MLVGKAYYYFENGLMWKTIELKAPTSNTVLVTNPSMDTLLNYQADSIGRVMVENGNGHLIEQTSDFTGAMLEGDYKDGLKHGIWTMKTHSGLYWYKEEYANGKFVSGESEMNGIISKYDSVDELPTMKGGIERFYNYLNRSIRYPSDAMRDNVQGKVFLSYVVERDGSLTNIKIERKLYPSLDAEAFRVLSACPKWIPGKQHGFPVRVKFNIPVSFTLSR